MDQWLKYAKSAWGSTVVIQMFGIGSSEAGSSVCLVNTHYCCSCLTNRSSFASHMNLVYGRQHSQAIVRPLCKTMARQSSPPWRCGATGFQFKGVELQVWSRSTRAW